MKRMLRILACIFLVCSLCACSERNKALEYIEEAWEETNADPDDVHSVYFIEYTSGKRLGDELDTVSFYDDIPKRGYAVIFRGVEDHVCFLSGDGEVEYVYDCQESKERREQLWRSFTRYDDFQAGEQSLRMHHDYICICSMIVDVGIDDENLLKGRLDVHVWYSLSRKQMEKIID